ncbi:MAG: glycosyltransferase family 2 protein [Thermodesulfobacteriota bacterium]
MTQAFYQTIIKKFIRYSYFVKIKKLLLNFAIFKSFNRINLLGMLSILLARERLSTIIDFLIKYLWYGEDYVKSQHLSIHYYQRWLKVNETYEAREIKANISRLSYKPLISIIITSDPHRFEWIDQSWRSVVGQFYPHWELCLYHQAAGPVPTPDSPAPWRQSGEPRLKLLAMEAESSRAQVYNSAWKQAQGEFIIFLAPGDTLSPDALYEVVRVLNSHPELAFIYSDEDKIQEDGIRFDPFFKPDWSPDLCLSMPYTGNLAVYRRAALENLGGFRDVFGDAAAYDLILRLSETISPAQIFHLPRILYHTRSGLQAVNQLPHGAAGHEAGKAVLNDYRRRHDIPGSVVDGALPGSYRLRRLVPDNLQVSIIIPFRDKVDLLEKCVTSILSKTDYQRYEIILVNNQSTESATIAYLQEMSDHPAIRLLSYNYPFNYSAINNYAARQTDADFILFLNNDTEVITPEWLRAMLESLDRREVGAVGAKLIYRDRTIQHAGVTMGITGSAGHAFRNFPADHPGYFGQLQVARNCSAVTAACMLVKKALFDAVGGFDQDNLPIAFNDVDLCLKMQELGYFIVWTPFALLYHHESVSRGDDRDFQGDLDKYQRINAELKFMEKKWGRYLDNDPYYNPNLTRLFENYGF